MVGMKNKFVLLIFFTYLCSCSSLPEINPFIVLDRENMSSYGDWYTSISDDPFDGKEIMSMVTTSGDASYRVYTDSGLRRNFINYRNGDGYICTSIYSGTYTMLKPIIVQHLFVKDTGEEYRVNASYAVSKNREALVLMNLGTQEGQLIYNLNNYDKMILRTRDECGNQVTNSFDIKGSTHLKISDVPLYETPMEKQKYLQTKHE